MKLPARSVVWLLPFLLTACFHRTHSSSSRFQPYAPPLSTVSKPTTVAIELPPSATTIPSQPLASDANSQPQEPMPPAKRRKFKNKNPQQAANNAQQPGSTTPVAGTESPEVSAVGLLSSGDPSDPLRQQTVDSIAATDRGLNGINRSLNDQEQKIAAQIKEYLKQARQALVTGDVDGAHTLAAKAKVLLGELSAE